MDDVYIRVLRQRVNDSLVYALAAHALAGDDTDLRIQGSYALKSQLLKSPHN